MSIENIKNEFPQMPDEIRTMIKREVEKQIYSQEAVTGNREFHESLKENVKTHSKNEIKAHVSRRKKKKRTSRRMAVLILAATLALGTSALAGVQLYKMYVEKIGEYAVKTTVQIGAGLPDNQNTKAETESIGIENATVTAEKESFETGTLTEKEETGTGEVASEASESAAVLGEVQFKNQIAHITYFPEGMIQAPTGTNFYYEENPWVGGISICFWKMDTEEPFEMLDTAVLESEEIEISGHDGVYLKRQVDFEEGESRFDKIIYVSYPEAEIIVEMHMAQNVSKEEAVKFAEGIQLVESEQPVEDTITAELSWVDYLFNMLNPDVEYQEPWTRASADDMKNTHRIGEEFYYPDAWMEIDGELGSYDNPQFAAVVSEVQVLEDSSVLNPEYMDSSLKAQFDSEGKLLPVEIRYMKNGDRIDSLDEAVVEETVEQKLVYVTVEYSNRSSDTMKNILHAAAITKMEETNGEYVIYERKPDLPDDAWDRRAYSSPTEYCDMEYFDVHGGQSNGTNYIDCLEPGETVTVHYGFLVNADELPYMYLSLSGSGGVGAEFSEASLELGYVDIRQG